MVHCPLMTPCGPHILCIIEEKSTIEAPCANKKCPHTPTVTVTAAPSCPTCQVGCATTTTLETITTGCASATQPVATPL
ncbi:hypothetical protein BUE80_DR013338 [Diplocarpon rosae]|nr:hypothetical protein BUE80_DR013338 [Diplocarpon rosae]